ncbi:futalosine hydrolase [Lewinella sp. IMCC34183]|uniref:futalosine hydrolase n=1 Tax=Lewinella sp. IMCC34183 TaxID=2248762 RepID=UPI0013002491|nr:futalosine hydrolase [Lewinella sp. IMCC34183]
MRLLLLAATPAEIAPTVTWLRETATATRRDVLQFPKTEIQLLFTGIGPVRTAFALGQVLQGSDRPFLAVQAGVAGTLDPSLDLGDVVNVTSELFYDDGAENTDGSPVNLPAMGFAFAAPFDADGVLRPPGPAGLLPFPQVAGGTAGRATGSAERIAWIRRHYPEVQVESMEGAAFIYAALSTGVEALQLRSISNRVTPRDREAWDLPSAITNLNAALRRVLEPFLQPLDQAE